MGAKVPENKSSVKRKFPRTFVPVSNSSRERMGQGAGGRFRRGAASDYSERARELAGVLLASLHYVCVSNARAA